MRSAALTLVLAFGCADQTAIVIELDSDLVVPDEIEQVQFEVYVDASEVAAARTVDLPGTWPETFAIRAGSVSTDEPITVVVSALRSGAIRVRRVATARFVADDEVRVRVELRRDCLDVVCAGTFVDCSAGLCVSEPPTDGGVDSGVDDAGADGSVVPTDTLPPDSGGEDAALDAGRDAAMDASIDASIEDTGAVDAGHDAGPPDTGRPDTSVLMGGVFFSEYLDPSAANEKALEIYNGSGSPLSLSSCTLSRFSNGMSSPAVVPIGGSTVASGDVFVVCHSSLEGQPYCDITETLLNHNGNDAYELRCDGSVVDTFGRIGMDPGNPGWTGGGAATVDTVLRRKCSVTTGDPNGADAFNPSVEWTPVDEADRTGFGTRGC